MYKIVLIIALRSILFSQDKMILKSGEEIILDDRTNYTNYEKNKSFIVYNSKFYGKKSIAQLKLDNGDIIFKSGMPISKYESLSIEKKAKADRRTSSKKFKNINQTLLDRLNEEQKEIYLKAYGSTVSSSGKSFCLYGGVCSILAIAVLLASPALWYPQF